MRISGIIVIALVWMLAACAEPPNPQGVVELPTLADLPTLTPTSTLPPSATFTATALPTETLTPTITPSVTVSVTPSATITDTPSPTPTMTPSPTPRQSALSLLADIADRVTVLPPELRPVAPPPLSPFDVQSGIPVGTPLPSTCPQLPPGGFGTLFFGTPSLAAQIGCPSGSVTTVNSALQTFEHGSMIWLSGPIYVLYSDSRAQRFDDTFTEGIDPVSGGETPPAGLVEPVRGFGKVWRNNPTVRAGLGWGTAPEAGGSATMQRFERGWMIDLTQRGDIIVLTENPDGLTGTWQSYAGSF